jgi:hypothetical protein
MRQATNFYLKENETLQPIKTQTAHFSNFPFWISRTILCILKGKIILWHAGWAIHLKSQCSECDTIKAKTDAMNLHAEACNFHEHNDQQNFSHPSPIFHDRSTWSLFFLPF